MDDGSTDPCPQICDDYAEHDSRIRVLHKQNGGISNTRNTGILAARGKYLIQVDSDDYLEKDAVEQLLRGALPGVDLIAGTYFDWHQNQQFLMRRVGLEEGKIYTSKDFTITSIINSELRPQIWSYMYRREFLIENKLFYKNGLIFEDQHLILDILIHASGISYIDAPFYNYTWRNGSITHSDNSWEKIHNNVLVLEHWKEIIDGIEDKTLQKYLYHELFSNYMNSSYNRKLIGWGFGKITFPYAFVHFSGLHEKVKVVRYQLKTIFCNLFPRYCDAHQLMTLKEYNSILAENNAAVKDGEK